MIKLDSTEYTKYCDLTKKSWKHAFTTNCYAFALGLDIAERLIKKDAYQPGTLTQHNLDMYFTFEQLIECLTSDLDYLGIEYHEAHPLQKVKENEWKIAIFVQIKQYLNSEILLSDFHFLREIDEVWYHKSGYYGMPTNKDSHSNIIFNPTECYIYGKEYQKTYTLKIKKN